MTSFELIHEQCTLGFQEHATIDLDKPISPQLNRRRLIIRRRTTDSGNPDIIKKIIERNASLRVDFGWAFESETHFRTVMDDCIQEVVPKYNVHAGQMIADLRCSWVGFVPHNIYDKEVYKDLSVVGLILYNNEIIDFQNDIISAMSRHIIYRQHAILRDNDYRFKVFKKARKDRDKLVELYQFYMNAFREVCGRMAFPRDILEEQIGTHFLYNPDTFFELLEFSILKGEVYE